MDPPSLRGTSGRQSDVFDFGITDTLQVGHEAGGLFIVQFTCGCTVVVGGGRILLWPGRVAAVCTHVRA